LSPHLLPAARGFVMTSYVRGDAEAVHGALAAAYEDEPFLHVLPMGEVPQMKDVRASNYCHIGVVGDRVAGRATIVATLDNLTKGSSGQAIQNANLMLGLDETLGLLAAPVFP
jgi:N-acetyl-gamma-glutamyl-phosphate reductase